MRILALIACAGLASVTSAAKFTTQRFDVTMAIQPDGTVMVREEIAITFTEPQRGLIRKLPSITKGRGNLRRRTQYELVGVQMSQGGGFGPSPAAEEMNGGDWQVRIGSKDRFLNGRVTYRIDYRILGAMTPFEAGEGLGRRTELYWNTFPTNWATAIERGRVGITYPKPEPGTIRARIFSGDVGTKGGIDLEPGKGSASSSNVRAQFMGQMLTAELTRPLNPGQTVTVVLALPGDTVVAPPPEIVEAPRPPTRTEMIAGTSLPFLPLIPLWFWRRKYRFSEGPMVVQFDPPQGMGPAECGLLIDGNFQPRDVVAGILSLAQKGAAKIRPDETQTTFSVRLLGLERARDLTNFEQALYGVLVPFGPEIDANTLNGRFGGEYQRLSGELRSSLYDRGLTLNRAMMGFGCGAGALFAVATLGLGMLATAFIFGFAICSSIVAMVLGAILVGTMSNLTREGTQVKGHVRGLREFIKRANADELRHMSRTMPAQAIFERLLPYALVFGYVEQWAKAFEGIQLEPPHWFESSTGYDYWTMHQINTLLIHDQSWNQAVVPPAPSSSSWSSGSTSSYDSGSSYSSGDSGFSDSGSSGGGGGGGGGDSW